MLNKLIKENPNINITIKAEELMTFGQSIVDRAIKSYINKHDEKVYSRNDVIKKFKICSATLWRWEKNGLIEGKKIGNRSFYSESEIKRLIGQKGI